MLANQVRRFGEALVDRHVLSRDRPRVGHRRSRANERAAAHVCCSARPRRREGSHRRARRSARSPVHRLPRDADPPGSARRCSPPTGAQVHRASPVDFEDHKLVVAFAEPADDEALAAIGHATTYEIIPAVADRDELVRRDRHDLRRRAADEPTAPRRRRRRISRRRPGADELHINDLLELVIQWGGSDLHLTVGISRR